MIIKKIDLEKAKMRIKKHYKKIGTVAVTLSLGIVCIGTVTGEISKASQTSGRMLVVSDLYDDNNFISTVDRITYSEMQDSIIEEDILAQIEKTEKVADEVLMAGIQEQKDQEALAAITQQQNQNTAVASSNPSSTPQITVSVPGTTSGQYLGQWVVTAYCPCPICCGAYSNMEHPTTASGAIATAGRTVAAPSTFAFGTQLVIDGVVYTVEDRGGAISGNRLDIFFNTHQEALNYGRRTVDVYAY